MSVPFIFLLCTLSYKPGSVICTCYLQLNTMHGPAPFKRKESWSIPVGLLMETSANKYILNLASPCPFHPVVDAATRDGPLLTLGRSGMAGHE